MQITLTKEQVREAFGTHRESRHMGADYCYKYDKETRKKTEEVEALKLHLGSMKLGNSVDIRLEATELPKVEPYTVVELEEAVYAPYVQRGNFPSIGGQTISCKVSVLLPEKETCRDCSRKFSADCSVQRERSKGSRGSSGNVAKATAYYERQG